MTQLIPQPLGGGGENIKEVIPNADGTYTISFKNGPTTITASSTNCLVAFLYDQQGFIEIPSEGVVDGQDTTFTINGVTYNGIWISDEYGSGWQLQAISDTESGTSSDSVSLMGTGTDTTEVGGVSRLIITEHNNGILMHYNKTKLATLTLTDGSVVKIEGYYNGTLTLTPEMIYPYRETLSEAIIHKDVDGIGSQAFYNCTSLTNVTIQDGLEFISSYAFSNCPSLETINIPNSVTSIQTGAFEGCTSLPVENNVRYADTYVVGATDKTLTTYTLKSGTRFIGGQAFQKCTNLTSITIPNSVIYIDYSAFNGCTSLTTVEMPNSLEKIGYNTFLGCTSLANITIPDSVKSIRFSAFEGCTSLTHVTIPNGVTNIDNSVFKGCTALTDVTIPDSVTSIGSYSFENCSSLTSIKLPNNLTRIGYSAFEGCTNITSIDIPNTVTSIEGRAFSGCKITSCVIPNGVTEMGTGVFYNCTELTEATIGNNVKTIETFTFLNCAKLKNIVLPDTLTSIGQQAFRACALTTINIPSTVTSIGVGAFRYCPFSTITSNAMTAPAIEADTFQQVKTNGTLYVPTGSTGYDVWMGTGDYYLGKYNWTKVEQ